MNRVQRKLRSRRGASITFALLLFLVCAVVSSVVIVAGTAAAGRMSRLAEMDQRYYAVTSAAELLCNDIADKTAVVETVSTTTKTGDGEPTTTSEPPALAKDGDGNTVSSGSALADDASLRLISLQAQRNAIDPTATPAPQIRAFDLSTSVDGDPLKCKVTETLNADGSLVLDIVNDNADGKGEYRLKVTFYSRVKAGKPSDEVENTTDDSGNVTESTTSTTQTAVTWNLYRVRREGR